jgi:histidinol-phosphate aminotransferase
MQAAARDTWKYGDPENHDLKAALAAHHGIAPENIVVGEGIDGLLGYLVRMLVGTGDPVVTSLGAYPTFNFHVAGFGGQLHAVPYRGDAEDPEALLAKAREVGRNSSTSPTPTTRWAAGTRPPPSPKRSRRSPTARS